MARATIGSYPYASMQESQACNSNYVFQTVQTAPYLITIRFAPEHLNCERSRAKTCEGNDRCYKSINDEAVKIAITGSTAELTRRIISSIARRAGSIALGALLCLGLSLSSVAVLASYP